LLSQRASYLGSEPFLKKGFVFSGPMHFRLHLIPAWAPSVAKHGGDVTIRGNR
jgi:hypothetical protein